MRARGEKGKPTSAVCGPLTEEEEEEEARRQEKDVHAPQEAEIKKREHRPEEKIADSESVSARPCNDDDDDDYTGGSADAHQCHSRLAHHAREKEMRETHDW